MLKKSEIPRMSIETMLETALVPTISEPEESMKDLGLQAERILGYTHLREAVDPIATTLARVLEKLEIEILDIKQVNLYKQEQLELAARGERKAHRRARNDEDDTEDSSSSADDEGDEMDEFEWNRISIPDYSRPIPTHVLHKAIQVKTALPTVDLMVEELIVQKRIDPFLIARYGKELYYIEVWNEPTFENRKVFVPKKK